MKAFFKELGAYLWEAIKTRWNFPKREIGLPAENLRDLLTVEDAKKAWQDSISYFQEVTEPALIDFAIFQMEAAEKKLVHLIRQMGQKYPEGIWPPNFRRVLGIFDFKSLKEIPKMEG